MFKATVSTVYQEQIDMMVIRAVPNRRLTVFSRIQIQIVVPTIWPNTNSLLKMNKPIDQVYCQALWPIATEYVTEENET